uniref:Uncharacterized protein n=1 Tax=Anguilla anguilla TaxID=7936 RepID=A0A0E9Q7A2_ANGAN
MYHREARHYISIYKQGRSLPLIWSRTFKTC